MSGHTPGPWVVEVNNWGETSVKSANDEDLQEYPIEYYIAERIGGHVRGEDFTDFSEVQANARLMAAAPDLLEALEKGAVRLEANLNDERDMGRGSMTYLLEVFQEAITRAKGEQV